MVEELSALVGARFQEVVTQEQALGLGFYHNRDMVWLVIDLHPTRPWIVLRSTLPFKNKAKPVGLFLKSHFVGRRLNAVRCLKEYGRVLVFDFGEREIEIHLIPHAVNAVARNGEKSISWNKLKSLEPAKPFVSHEPVRGLRELTAEWEGSQPKEPSKVQSTAKALEKKKKALATLIEGLNKEEWREYQEAGDWEKAKKLKEKDAGTRKRIEVLKLEIADLEAGKTQAVKEKPPTLYEAGATGRTHVLANGITLYIGRSAKDNLNLLRRANSWDLWVHLRDFPGAHGIIHRNRGAEVTDDLLEKAALLVARESARKYLSDGDKFDCLFAECRFVKPIKGDKIGRVTYREEFVRRYRYQPK